MQKHEPWLSIAQEDLSSAKCLHANSLMTTLFHIQQCAEKSLKAYLVFKQGASIKTHDLVILVNRCMKFNKYFEPLRASAVILTPYETAGRYPDIFFAKPTKEKTLNLINQAEYIFNFVLQQVK